jgi:hypothetical protein
MIKLISLFFIAITVQPIFAENQVMQNSTNLTFHSENFLGLKNSLRPSNKGIVTHNIRYNLDNLSSQLSLNYDGYNKFTFDRSYLQYTSGIATYGLGAIDRHWSFSDNTSLILSHNARPTKSIYLIINNKFGYHRLPSKANWSFEAFNGFTEESLNNTKSMLLGMRAIISPIEGLDFEIVQTSQWGGEGNETGLSAFGAALLFDTNKNKNANINKMAGFGISYSIPSNEIPLRIYGQAVGEDEAGNLPSCYGYLAGIELSNTRIKYPTTVGIEIVDTRIDTTRHGNCGANTMYNNKVYDYTNYGKTIGAAIDSEGTSLGLFVRSQISQKIDIEYSTKSVVINDSNWSNNRLSSKRQSGFINSLGASWNKNSIKFNGDIYYQGFNLDKAMIKNGYGVSFSSSIMF